MRWFVQLGRPRCRVVVRGIAIWLKGFRVGLSGRMGTEFVDEGLISLAFLFLEY